MASASHFGEVVSLPSTAQGSTSIEAKVRKWVREGYSSRIPPNLILSNPNHQKYKTPRQVRKLASLMERHSFFGERTLALSSVTGKCGCSLDQSKLAALKQLVAQLFPALAPEELEAIWSTCTETIRDLCKRLRYQLKQYNLLQTAASYEGVPVPNDQ